MDFDEALQVGLAYHASRLRLEEALLVLAKAGVLDDVLMQWTGWSRSQLHRRFNVYGGTGRNGPVRSNPLTQARAAATLVTKEMYRINPAHEPEIYASFQALSDKRLEQAERIFDSMVDGSFWLNQPEHEQNDQHHNEDGDDIDH